MADDELRELLQDLENKISAYNQSGQFPPPGLIVSTLRLLRHLGADMTEIAAGLRTNAEEEGGWHPREVLRRLSADDPWWGEPTAPPTDN